MTIVEVLQLVIILSDLLFAITIVFFERKAPAAAWAWLLVLFFLPVVGFVLYMFLAQNYRKKEMFHLKSEADQKLTKIIETEKHVLRTRDIPAMTGLPNVFRRMVLMLLENNNAVLRANNDVTLCTDGKEKFAGLLSAIRSARDHVHLEYYIWRNDKLSNKLRAALTERAHAGVAVRLLCDGLECARLPRDFFSELERAGGQVAFFFPSRTRILNVRSNFRNHRKIAVIDGTTSFVGGSTSATSASVRSKSGGIGATLPCAFEGMPRSDVSSASFSIGTMRRKHISLTSSRAISRTCLHRTNRRRLACRSRSSRAYRTRTGIPSRRPT